LNMSAKDKQIIEEQFMTLYMRDDVLKSLLGPDPTSLSLF